MSKNFSVVMENADVREMSGKSLVRENCLPVTVHLVRLNILGHCTVFSDSSMCITLCKAGKS